MRRRGVASTGSASVSGVSRSDFSWAGRSAAAGGVSGRQPQRPDWEWAAAGTASARRSRTAARRRNPPMSGRRVMWTWTTGTASARAEPRYPRRLWSCLAPLPRPCLTRPLASSFMSTRPNGKVVGKSERRFGLPCKANSNARRLKCCPTRLPTLGRSLGQKKGSPRPVRAAFTRVSRSKVNAQVVGVQFTGIYKLCVRVVGQPEDVRKPRFPRLWSK